MGYRDDLVPGQSLGEASVTTVGTYSSIISEAAQNSEGGYSTTANPDTQTVHTGPSCPAVQLHERAAVSQTGGSGQQ